MGTSSLRRGTAASPPLRFGAMDGSGFETIRVPWNQRGAGPLRTTLPGIAAVAPAISASAKGTAGNAPRHAGRPKTDNF